MGKIRVSKFGNEEQEEKQQQKTVHRQLLKRAKKEGATVEEITEKATTVRKKATVKKQTSESATADTKQKEQKPKKHTHSKRYTKLAALIDRNAVYELSAAIELIKKTGRVGKSETIEAHINLRKTAKELGLKNTKKKDAAKTIHIAYEKKLPVAHVKIGTSDESNEKIAEVVTQVIKTIGIINITKLTLSSTFGPGVKVRVT